MCAAWKKKNERNESAFLLYSVWHSPVALQGSVGEIRTNLEHFSLKNEKKLRPAHLKQNLLVLIKKVYIYELETRG